MAFKSFADIGRLAETEGFHYAYVHKPQSPAGSFLRFIDLSISTGVPRYNAYPGGALEATQLNGSGNIGIYAGTFTPGRKKRLMRLQMMDDTAGTPSSCFLLDYLLFYPLIDLDESSPQDFNNPVSLPRYASGEGVRMFLVNTAPVTFSGATITLSYTNSDGVPGRTISTGVLQSTTAGTVISCAGSGLGSDVSPFYPLAAGDRGVRSVQSVTCVGNPGGFAVLVLCKPIATISLSEQRIMAEKEFGVFETPPEVLPGAYLHYIIQRNSASSSYFRSELLFMNE